MNIQLTNCLKLVASLKLFLEIFFQSQRLGTKMTESFLLIVLASYLTLHTSFFHVKPLFVSRKSLVYSTVNGVQEPPKTFLDCVARSALATKKALDDGVKLIEVEFPPLPLEVLEDSSSSARDIAEANTKWATEFAKSFIHRGKVSLIYPDQPG